uniref:Uncharacterized protein n=1 Tax=Romanomermis culicivorax TaxID=13658 RepID=A0A915HQB0_ROMCU
MAYKSIERYSFHKDAMATGDKEAVDATNSVKAENFGETLAWDLPKLGIWHNSAYNAFYKAYGY